MALGLLFDILPWRSQKQVIDQIQVMRHQMFLEFGQAIHRALEKPRGIRGSWTGWDKIHSKIKIEARHTWRLPRVQVSRARLRALNGMALK